MRFHTRGGLISVAPGSKVRTECSFKPGRIPTAMKSTLPLFVQPRGNPEPAGRGLPLLRLGFRPFYLCAAALGAVAVPLWVAMFLGHVSFATAAPPMLWHAHEMLFGFAIAVIVGFLLTAGKAWTGLDTPRGAFLGALALLWIAARLAAVGAPYAVYAFLDVVLLPIVAAVFGDVLVRAKNRRNLPLVGILILLSVANLLFHLSVMGVVDVAATTPLYAGLALIVMIECVIAGRVVPAFTMNATPGLKLALSPALDRLALAATALGLLAWVCGPDGVLPALALAVAAVLQVARAWQWRPWITRTRPILWILHAAYAWIPLGLALLALAKLGWVPVSAGVHALAVGATGGLIIGMITRTARGHTGRMLHASKPEVLAYALVMAAAVLRVLLPLAGAALYVPSLIGAAAAWGIAFAIYLWRFTPWLMQPRVDGKDG